MDYELLVDGEHLRHGARLFKMRRKVRPSDKATIGFADGYGVFNAFDRGFVASATGLWPGIAETGAAMWAALSRVPPTGDQVAIRYSAGRLKIGTFAMEAHWRPTIKALLKAPAAPDWVTALSLKYRVPPAEAVASGYGAQITEAERKLDLLIARTAKSLSALGVTEDDLHTLVHARLMERWGFASDDPSDDDPKAHASP